MRARISVFGILQPRSALQHPHPGRSQETHLRRELSRLLAAIVEIDGQLPVEENHRLAHRHPILRSTKAQNIHAVLPTQLRWCAAQARARIRESRSVHVQRETMLLASGGDCPNLPERIYAPRFRRLRNRHNARLGIVNVLALRCQFPN